MTDTVPITIEVTEPVAEQIVAAAALTGQHPTAFVEEAVLNSLQAVDNLMHGDEHIELPDDFDAEAWRRRYEHIRRPEVYDGES